MWNTLANTMSFHAPPHLTMRNSGTMEPRVIFKRAFHVGDINLSHFGNNKNLGVLGHQTFHATPNSHNNLSKIINNIKICAESTEKSVPITVETSEPTETTKFQVNMTNSTKHKKDKKSRQKHTRSPKKTDKPFHKQSLTNEIYEISAVDIDLLEADSESCPPAPKSCSFVVDIVSLIPEKSKQTKPPSKLDKSPNFCIEIIPENIKPKSDSPSKMLRCRVPSVCESDDSFIVFEGNCEEDEVDGGDLSDVSSEFEAISESELSSGLDSDLEENDLFTSVKKVRFADEKNLREVHPMVKWWYAYQAARKGPWEQYARDRERFGRRIEEAETLIGGVLQPKHRARIYAKRFVEKKSKLA